MAAAVCPPSAVIEAFVAGTCTDQTVIVHLEGCPACRAAADQVRKNQQFMAEVRIALAAPGASGAPPGGDHAAAGSNLLAGYRLQEEIYRGGQGVVYRAVQTRTGRTVAIKLLPGGPFPAGRQRERFEREVRMAAGLRHPNIVTVHDSGYTPDGRCALVMEYIEGVHLDHWSRSLDGGRSREARRRALRERLTVMAKVCDAVLCAHQHSIVHRDLKPGNILVDAAGEPHVVDFGIARDLGPEQRTRLTHTGEFAGTLAYASPEQVSGDPARVDTRTDIYSLGVIMYELVSGRMPYAVDGPMSRTLRSIESAEPAPLPRRTRDPDDPWVDGEVATIILKAMAKDPARRYQTAAGVRNDIGRYLAGEAIDARRDSTWYILRKTAARHRVIFAAVALIVVLLAGFGAAMARQAHRLEVRGRELAARGSELASALSASNVERGRMLAEAGNYSLAADVIWPELLGAGVTRIDGPEAGYAGSPEVLHAYWALWDVFRGSSNLATLRTRGDEVELLYFEEGGRHLSALNHDGTLTSWSVATWEPVRDTNLVAPIDGPGKAGFHAARAPGGDIGIFGEGMLRVIDPGTGAIIAQADNPDEQAVTGAFSPDGTLLATIGRDRRLRIRDARTLEVIATTRESVICRAHPWSSRPTFAPDGRLVAAVCPDGSLGLWSVFSGVRERTLPPPESIAGYVRGGVIVWTIAFAPDGTIAAGLGEHVAIWPADGGPAQDLGAPFGLIRSVAFFPGSQGKMLVSSGSTPGGGNAATILWNLATGERAATFKHADEMFACAVSPDARLIAVGCESGTVRVFEAVLEPHISVLRPGVGRGSIIALSPDGRFLALTETVDNQAGTDVLLIDLESGATRSRFHWPRAIEGLVFAPDGSSLFGCEESGRSVSWDLPSGTLRHEYAFPDPAEHRRKPDQKPSYTMHGLNQMRLSPDGRVLAQAREDGLIGLWNVPSGDWIGWLDSGVPDTAIIDFSPDGRTLAAHHPEMCILWDMRSRQPKRTIATDKAYPSVRFSPAGAAIAHGVRGCIQFFDASTGRVLSQNKDPNSSGIGMVFHPGGSVFFASAFDSSIRLWDPRTGRELLSLRKHTALIHSLLLTPDGNTLISADNSGVVLAWDLTYYNDRIRRELAYRAAHPKS